MFHPNDHLLCQRLICCPPPLPRRWADPRQQLTSRLPYQFWTPAPSDSPLFTPFAWSDLPLFWEVAYGAGNCLLAWALDSSDYEWKRRDNVLGKWTNDSEGPEVVYKARPLSAPTPTHSNLSATSTFNVYGTLVANLKLNGQGLISVDRSGETPALALSSQAWFLHDKSKNIMDIPTLLERAQVFQVF